MGLLGWAILSLVISFVAGALGFTGVAADAAKIAKFCFILFLVIAVALFLLVMFGIGAAAAGAGVVH